MVGVERLVPLVRLCPGLRHAVLPQQHIVEGLPHLAGAGRRPQPPHSGTQPGERHRPDVFGDPLALVSAGGKYAVLHNTRTARIAR